MANLSNTVTFLFAGDGSLASDGLSAFLQTKTNFLLISECSDGASAVADIEAHSPEIAVIDFQFPDMTAAQVIQKVRPKNRTTKIVVLGAGADRNIADELLAVGADAYVVRSGPSRHLNDAIRYIRDGGKYLAPQLTTDLPVASVKSEHQIADSDFRAAFEAQGKVVSRLDQALERAQLSIGQLEQKVEKLSAASVEPAGQVAAEFAVGENGAQSRIHKIRTGVGTVAASLIVGVLGFQLAGILRPGPVSPLADSSIAGTLEPRATSREAAVSQLATDEVAEAAALLKQQQYGAAEKLCRTLLKQTPGDIAVSRILASALFHQNRVAESAEVVRTMAVPTTAGAVPATAGVVPASASQAAAKASSMAASASLR